jgi:hypothetical protein
MTAAFVAIVKVAGLLLLGRVIYELGKQLLFGQRW